MARSRPQPTCRTGCAATRSPSICVSLGRPVTRAAWLECAYGSSNEIVLEQDKETREWVRRHFPTDPNEPVT